MPKMSRRNKKVSKKMRPKLPWFPLRRYVARNLKKNIRIGSFGGTNSLPFSVHGYAKYALLNAYFWITYIYIKLKWSKYERFFHNLILQTCLSLLPECMVWLYSRGLYRNLLIPRMAKIRPCYKRGRGRRERVLRKKMLWQSLWRVSGIVDTFYFMLIESYLFLCFSISTFKVSHRFF